MGALEESRAQLIAAFQAWDWSPAFPASNYSGVKAPVVVAGWPYDVIDNILQENAGVMTQPVVSLIATPMEDTYRALGDHFGPGAGGKQRFGTRVMVTFAVVCWADQQLGGGDLVEKLAGQVQGCCFFNRNRLAAYRQLRTSTSSETYRDRQSLWRYDVTVTGFGVVSYDV